MKEKEIKIAVMDILAKSAGDAYFCTRAWEAWGHGTMSQADFVPVGEDANWIAETADELIKAMKSFTDNIHPPTEGPCPDCDGTGERYYRPHPWKKDQAPVFEVCAKCKGKKKVQIYYTPAEYTEWMHANGKPEFELKDEDSVWAHHGDYGWVTLTIRSAAGYLKESGYTGLLYVAQPGQGRP